MPALGLTPWLSGALDGGLDEALGEPLGDPESPNALRAAAAARVRMAALAGPRLILRARFISGTCALGGRRHWCTGPTAPTDAGRDDRPAPDHGQDHEYRARQPHGQADVLVGHDSQRCVLDFRQGDRRWRRKCGWAQLQLVLTPRQVCERNLAVVSHRLLDRGSVWIDECQLACDGRPKDGITGLDCHAVKQELDRPDSGLAWNPGLLAAIDHLCP